MDAVLPTPSSPKRLSPQHLTVSLSRSTQVCRGTPRLHGLVLYIAGDDDGDVFIEVEKPGGPEELKLVRGAVPKPGPSEVVLRVEAAGVNRADILQRKGAYPPPEGASPVLGLEVAGSIAVIGSAVTEWAVGDPRLRADVGRRIRRVLSRRLEAMLTDPPRVQRDPSGRAAGGLFSPFGANVFIRGRLERGETFLVHGGSSGIGTAAIQIAREFGARVFATAGSRSKCEALRKARC